MPANLADLAALLVQLDPEDRAEAERLRSGLVEVAATCAPAIAKLLNAAADQLQFREGASTADLQTAIDCAARYVHAATAAGGPPLPPRPASPATPPATPPTPPPVRPASPAPPPAPPPPPPPSFPQGTKIEIDAELIAEFVAESRDHLAKAELALLNLERDATDAASVAIVFRAFHSLKGTASLLEIREITELAHNAESVLVRVRDGKAPFDPACATISLRSVDVLKELLDRIEQGAEGTTRPEDLRQLLGEIAAYLASDHHAAPAHPAPPPVPPLEAAPAAPLRLTPAPKRSSRFKTSGAPKNGAASKTSKAPRTSAAPKAPPSPKISILPIASDAKGTAEPRTPEEPKPQPRRSVAPRRSAAPGPDGARPAAANKPGRADVSDQSVRIRTDRLDRLIDLVGEMVIAQSMVTQDTTLSSPVCHELSKKVGRLGKLVRELQDLSMSLRMVPLRPTFQKMTRVVRDTGKRAGRQAELVTYGDETEIDRNMVDVIADPLVHMVRNAVDHGIEPADVRRRAGKPETGTVTLRAYHASGYIVLQLSDDGAGLDRARLVSKAIAKRLITSDAGMSDADVYNLIFEAGFSTKEQVTDVSGRGVGMDVVRQAINALHGHIDITSEIGKGTTFTVRLPLTLAITDGMLARVATERFIVPTASIRISVRTEPGMLSTVAGRGEMVLFRGEALPVLRLGRLFSLDQIERDPNDGVFVVVSDGDSSYALHVDELLGQQQVVVKPLGDGLGRVRGISGGAVLGDGRVGLILDTAALAAVARGA